MPTAKLYLPTQADNFDTADEEILDLLCEEYGGCTTYEGTGHWKNPEGTIVRENVMIYETSAGFGDSIGHMTAVMSSLATDVKDMTDETTVMVSVDGDKILV